MFGEILNRNKTNGAPGGEIRVMLHDPSTTTSSALKNSRQFTQSRYWAFSYLLILLEVLVTELLIM